MKLFSFSTKNIILIALALFYLFIIIFGIFGFSLEGMTDVVKENMGEDDEENDNERENMQAEDGKAEDTKNVKTENMENKIIEGARKRKRKPKKPEQLLKDIRKLLNLKK